MLGTYSLNFIFTVYRVGWAGLSAEVREGKGRSEGRREKMGIFFNNLLKSSPSS